MAMIVLTVKFRCPSNSSMNFQRSVYLPNAIQGVAKVDPVYICHVTWMGHREEIRPEPRRTRFTTRAARHVQNRWTSSLWVVQRNYPKCGYNKYLKCDRCSTTLWVFRKITQSESTTREGLLWAKSTLPSLWPNQSGPKCPYQDKLRSTGPLTPDPTLSRTSPKTSRQSTKMATNTWS